MGIDPSFKDLGTIDLSFWGELGGEVFGKEFRAIRLASGAGEKQFEVDEVSRFPSWGCAHAFG